MPYLALRVDQHNANSSNTFKINLKGIIVGNGVTNWEWDGDTSYIKIGFFHGLYGSGLQSQLIKNNCTYLFEDIKPDDSKECKTLLKKF